MIKYKTEEALVKKKFFDTITCDRCNQEYSFNDRYEEASNFMMIKHHPGWGSKFDGSIIECDLCETCWTTMMPFRSIDRPTYKGDC